MKLLEQMDLTGVQLSQRNVFPYILLEETEYFTVDDSDIGNVVNQTMNIQLNVEELL